MTPEDSPSPPLPASPPSSTRPALAAFLSVALTAFLTDATVSLLASSINLIAPNEVVSAIAGLIAIPAFLIAILLYGGMALTPAIPKRWFLPLALYNPVASLLVLPLLIYFHENSAWIAWGISLGHLILCLTVLHHFRGSLKFRWPLVTVDQLENRTFRWPRFLGFVAIHPLVILPLVTIYLLFCGTLAVDHFSDGFVRVKAQGLTMQARKYVREDGKTVELVPMIHIGDPEFYQSLSESFPTTATVLLEGVSDNGNLLPEKVGYGKTAATLGLTEQHGNFRPQGKLVHADVDLSQFSKDSIEFLRQVMGMHSEGSGSMPMFVKSPSPEVLDGIFKDLLVNRNRHLLQIFQEQLLQSDHLVIPWGAAHMPGISKGILEAGFQLEDTREFVAVRFGAKESKSPNRPNP